MVFFLFPEPFGGLESLVKRKVCQDSTHMVVLLGMSAATESLQRAAVKATWRAAWKCKLAVATSCGLSI